MPSSTSSQTPEPLSPEREAEIRNLGDDEHRTTFTMDDALHDALSELDRVRSENTVALPAEWDCAHGTSEDEDHECPVIRVHRDDTEKFAALVDQAHESLADQERTTRYYAEQAKRRGDELKKMDRSRPTNDAYDAACKALWKHRDRADKAEAERDDLKKRLYDAAMTQVWTNEDGKKFVFVEDIAPALLGTISPEGGAR